MTSNLYINDAEVWTQVNRPYVRQNGVWKPVTQVFIKRNGAWTGGSETNPIYLYDETPPPPPELSLNVNTVGGSGKNKNYQYIQVGVRLPLTQNVPYTGIAYIRVLVGGVGPKGQFATNVNSRAVNQYITASDDSFTWEPWSDFYYNGYGKKNHASDSAFVYKQWSGKPANPDDKSQDLGTGPHRFTAWAVDFDGNASIPVNAVITVPKSGNPATYVKGAKFAPRTHGTVLWTANNEWKFGDLDVNGMVSPHQFGMFMYGTDIINSIGQNDPKVAIRGAQIKIQRASADNGPATTSVFIAGSHQIGSAGDIGPATGFLDYGPYNLGGISKGQSKWFELPAGLKSQLNNGLKSVVLFFAPSNKIAPSSTAVGYYYGPNQATGAYIDAGTINVTWTENPNSSK